MNKDKIFQNIIDLTVENEQLEFKAQNTFNLNERQQYKEKIKENNNQIDILLDHYSRIKEGAKV